MENTLETIVDMLGNWSVGTEPLYRLLAAALGRVIREQYLTAGTRLPPERKLAGVVAVSRSTVVAAYEVLRKEDLVESRRGSGTVVKVLKSQRDIAKDGGYHGKLSRQFRAEVAGYRKPEMVDFATGTVAGLKEMVKKASKFTSSELDDLLSDSGYSQSGLPVLRLALARWFTETGLPTNEDQILITTGAQQAITLLTHLYTRRGDVVTLDNPSYLGAIDIFKACGTRLTGISFSNDWNKAKETEAGIDLLEKKLCETAPSLLYLMPTFQNPTGFVLPTTYRRRIASLSEELELPVIEDHTLSFFELSNKIPVSKPIASFAASDSKIFIVGSLSKLFWPGLRVGWIRGTATTIASLTRLKIVNDLGSPILDQCIAARLLPQINQAKKLREKQLLPRKHYLEELLKKNVPDWEWREPEGGLFLWVKLPKGRATELAQLALRNGVNLMPGENLSVDGAYRNYLRLPFFLELAYLKEGVERMVAVWKNYS